MYLDHWLYSEECCGRTHSVVLPVWPDASFCMPPPGVRLLLGVMRRVAYRDATRCQAVAKEVFSHLDRHDRGYVNREAVSS